MATMASLQVEVGGNITNFVNAMTKMEYISKQRSAAMVKTFRSAALSIGAAFSIGLFARFVQGVIDVEDAIFKMSQKLGMSVQEISGLRHAAQLSGVQFEELGKAVKTLSQKMIEAQEPTSKSAMLMRALGVDIRGGTLPAINKIADAFKAMPDGATKTALSVELFSKAGMGMLLMLNQGSAGLDEMRAEAQRLGLILDTEAAAAMEQFNDNMLAVKRSVDGATHSMLNTMAPSLVRITNAMKQAAEDSGILAAAWVALGGIAAEALGMNQDMSGIAQNKREIKRLQDEINEREVAYAALQEHGLWVAEQERAAREREIALAKEKLAVQLLIQAAYKGEFDDQASRTARQGQKNVMQGVAKDASRMMKELNSIMSGSNVKAEVGADLLLQMEQTYAGLRDVTKERAHEERALLEIQKQTYILINPQMAKRIIQLAKETDELVKQQRTMAALDAEHQKDLEYVQAKGDALEELVNGWADATEQMEIEAKLVGLSNADREKALLLEKARVAIMAADGSAAAIREINDNLHKQLALLDEINEKQRLLDVWTELSTKVADFFTDLALNGRKAFRNLGDYLKDFARQMVAFFAKKWVLSMVAGLTGSAALASQAAQLGQGTLVGAAGSAAGGWLGSLLTGGSSIGAAFSNLGTGIMAGIAGESVPLMLANPTIAAFGAEIGMLLTNPATWIVAAAAIAFAIARGRSGGPKPGGSFGGIYDAQGNQIGTDATRLFTPNTQDAQMQQMVEQFAGSFFSTLNRMGGTTAGMTFRFGTDQDPRGSAASRVSAQILRDGVSIFESLMEAGRDDEDLQRAFALTMSRMMLGGLQQSNLPAGIASILNSVSAATGTTEEINAVIALATAFGDLMMVISQPIDVDSILRDASRTAQELLGAQADALLEYANSAGLTVDSLSQLTQGTSAYRQAVVSLITQFEQARRSIDEMFQSSIRNWSMVGLDDQGVYNFLQQETDALFEQLLAANDVATISRLAQQIDANMNEAFNLLAPEQQASMADVFIERARTVNEAVQEHIRAVSDEIANTAQENLDRLQGVLDGMAAKLDLSADKQLLAANLQNEAAGKTLRLSIDLVSGQVAVGEGA